MAVCSTECLAGWLTNRPVKNQKLRGFPAPPAARFPEMPPCVQPSIRMAWPGVPGFYGLSRGLVLSPSGSSGLTRVSFSSALPDTARVTVHGTRRDHSWPWRLLACCLLLLGCSLHHPNESAHVVQKRHRRPKRSPRFFFLIPMIVSYAAA